MLRQTSPRHTDGPPRGDALFLSGMLGVHAAQLVGLVATVGWLCPRIWVFLYDIFVLRPIPSAARAASLCQFCSTHRTVIALTGGVALALDWLVIRQLLRGRRATTCLVYCISVVLCVLLLQGVVLYGLGSASLQVHSMAGSRRSPPASAPWNGAVPTER